MKSPLTTSLQKQLKITEHKYKIMLSEVNTNKL